MSILELSCIVYIYGAHLSDEGMKKTGEFFKNLNESILNVRVQRIGTGSIILYVIIYKEAMKDKTCLHNSLCIIMEKMFPFFHDFGRCEKTIQIALYAAQGFFAGMFTYCYLFERSYDNCLRSFGLSLPFFYIYNACLFRLVQNTIYRSVIIFS